MFDIINQIFGGDKASQGLKKVLDKGALLIDVRTPAEFDIGHAEGAVNIPLQHLKQEITNIKAEDKPVIAYCRSGNRSGMAAQLLNNQGIEAYNAGSLGQAEALLNA